MSSPSCCRRTMSLRLEGVVGQLRWLRLGEGRVRLQRLMRNDGIVLSARLAVPQTIVAFL